MTRMPGLGCVHTTSPLAVTIYAYLSEVCARDQVQIALNGTKKQDSLPRYGIHPSTPLISCATLPSGMDWPYHVGRTVVLALSTAGTWQVSDHGLIARMEKPGEKWGHPPTRRGMGPITQGRAQKINTLPSPCPTAYSLSSSISDLSSPTHPTTAPLLRLPSAGE